MAQCLEWSHAWAGRLEGDADAVIRNGRGQADVCAQRLVADMAAGKLPFIDLPFYGQLEQELEALKPLLDRYQHLLLLGIGGSALGARALQKAFAPQQDQPGHTGPWLWIADNVDAASLDMYFERLPAQDTLIVAVSKSGGTIETISQYFLCCAWLQKKLGSAWHEHMVVVTDAHKGFLREQAQAYSLSSLAVPDNLGGRYSALSAVGLVPAAFLGMDWKALLTGARDFGQTLHQSAVTHAMQNNPAWSLAVWNMALSAHHYSQIIFFSYIPSWAMFGPWFCQLWAESLGKDGKGTMPLPAVGVTDQHSLQQMFLDGPRDKGCLFLSSQHAARGAAFSVDLPDVWAHLRGAHFGDLLQAEALGTRMALTTTHVPLVEMRMDATDTYAAGRMMALLECATLLTGWLMEINPLDQPAVELGKRLANARLGAAGYQNEKKALADFLQRPEEIQAF